MGGLVLTSLITALTVYGIIANTSSPILEPVKETEKAENIRQPGLAQNLDELKEQVGFAIRKLDAEKQRNTQLTYLVELGHQLNDTMDQPVAVQRDVNTLQRVVKCTVVTLMIYEANGKEFVTLASSSAMTIIFPPGHRQSAGFGLYGHVSRQKKTIIVNETNEIYRLIDAADKRLYVVKERGRNQIEPEKNIWQEQ